MEPFNDQITIMEQRQAKKIISRAGFVLSIMTVVLLAAQLLITFLVDRYYPAVAETNWYVWAVTAITIIGFGLPIYALLMRRIPNTPKGEVIKLSPLVFIRIFFICTAAMYISNILGGIITMIIANLKGQKELLNPIQEVMKNSNFLVALLYASIIAPIVEEVIFRKLLLDKLRRFGDLPAILMTGIAFGLFHMNLSQFFYAAVLGCIFAYVTIKTNTIRYSILLHMLINFLGTAISPFAISGNAIAYIFLLQWMLFSIVVGLICFFYDFKKIKLEKSKMVFINKSDFVLNTGTILYLLLCIVMIVINTIYS